VKNSKFKFLVIFKTCGQSAKESTVSSVLGLTKDSLNNYDLLPQPEAVGAGRVRPFREGCPSKLCRLSAKFWVLTNLPYLIGEKNSFLRKPDREGNDGNSRKAGSDPPSSNKFRDWPFYESGLFAPLAKRSILTQYSAS
jgi:hypothetical protein